MADGFRLQGDTGVSPPSALNAMLALGLNTEGADEVNPDVPGEKPGDYIRNYRLVDLLGEGGFGTVWRAQQLEPIQREVALKLIKPGMSSRAIVARFEAERQALAMMDHPNIAAVLDAGSTSDGRSFFAMELVRGVPITTYCDEHHLTLRERIELFLPVCDAVQHAHQKGIIHRDLKPSNILVTKCDRGAIPKVIDFGVAKALGSSDLPAFQASMLYTQVGAVIGTLQYMSPEQAGSAQDVDTRSDIYTLGVILYELLTGCTPFQREDCTRMAFDEALRFVREGQTNGPSSHHFSTRLHLTTVAGLRQLDPTAFKRLLRGDLDWITIRALEKNRTRRYATAAALADDLQRYLDGLPVSAVAPSWHYQFYRFATRHRLAIVTACLITTSLLAGTGISLWQASQATRARGAAEASRIIAEEKSREAEESLAHARTAVETYLGTITSDPRLSQSDFLELRRELLKSALPLYEQMLSRAGNSDLRLEQATALHRLASLYQKQGDPLKAEEIHLRAARILDDLLKADPGNLACRRKLQELDNDLATLLNYRGDGQGSIETFHRAIALSEGILREASEDGDLHNFATVLTNYGMTLEGRRNFEEAYRAYNRALEIENDLERRHPRDPSFPAQAAVSYANIARAYMVEGNRQNEAEQAFQAAVAIQERLVRDYPENEGHSDFLGQSYYGLGMVVYGRKPEVALSFFQRAIQLQEQLTNRFPKNPAYASVLAKGHLMRATILGGIHRNEEAMLENEKAGRITEALAETYPAVAEFSDLSGMSFERVALYQADNENWPSAKKNYLRAIQGYQDSLRQQADNVNTRNHLIGARRALAEVYLASGDFEAAVLESEGVPPLMPDRWEQYDFTATVQARAALAIASDPSLPRDQLQARVNTYRQKAVEMLRLAIDHGHPNASHLQTYAVFEVLHSYRPFQELTGTAPVIAR